VDLGAAAPGGRADRDFAIVQILDRAVVSTEFVEISQAAGLTTPVRILVKRILRKYGYPPDLESAAVQTALAQAEALSAQWAA
jgi:hypothetical protein